MPHLGACGMPVPGRCPGSQRAPSCSLASLTPARGHAHACISCSWTTTQRRHGSCSGSADKRMWRPGQPRGPQEPEGLCAWESGSDRSSGLRTEKAGSKPSTGSSEDPLSSLIRALCILWLRPSLPSCWTPLCPVRSSPSGPGGAVGAAPATRRCSERCWGHGPGSAAGGWGTDVAGRRRFSREEGGGWASKDLPGPDVYRELQAQGRSARGLGRDVCRWSGSLQCPGEGQIWIQRDRWHFLSQAEKPGPQGGQGRDVGTGRSPAGRLLRTPAGAAHRRTRELGGRRGPTATLGPDGQYQPTEMPTGLTRTQRLTGASAEACRGHSWRQSPSRDALRSAQGLPPATEPTLPLPALQPAPHTCGDDEEQALNANPFAANSSLNT